MGDYQIKSNFNNTKKCEKSDWEYSLLHKQQLMDCTVQYVIFLNWFTGLTDLLSLERVSAMDMTSIDYVFDKIKWCKYVSIN